MSEAEEALLCHYYQQKDEAPVTIEELEATYPRVAKWRLAAVANDLSRRGFIEYVPPAGHRITEDGIQHYLEAD